MCSAHSAEEDRYPLSAVQHAMLLHSIAAPGDGVYIQQKVLSLGEALDRASFEQALRDVAARNPVLRTTFDLDAPNGAVQIVRRHAPPALTYLDGRERTNALGEYLAADRRTPFEFVQTPPMRFALIRTGERAYEFVWTSHHALMDGRSYLILLTELFECYEALVSAGTPTIQMRRPFSGYIRSLARQNLAAAEAFWRERLMGIRAAMPLRGGPVATADGGDAFGETAVDIPERLSSALSTAASRHGVTANSFVQGAWALVLARWTGSGDVLFGAAKSCRASVEGGHDMVGLCMNTLPFRARIDPSMSVIEFLRQLRYQQVAVRAFERTPLPLIRRWCAIPPQEPFFESVVVFEDYRIDSRLRALGDAWANRKFRLYERSGYPLTLSAYLDASLFVKLGYCRRRFSDSTAETILGDFRFSLENMIADTGAALGQLLRRRCGTAHAGLHGAAADYPRDRCAHQLFSERARSSPETAAVLFEGRAVTCRELDRRSSRMAAFLGRNGIGPGSFVGVCLKRSEEMVTALLAVMKSGAAYVPMDPAYPAERLAHMIDDARIPLVIADSSLHAEVRGGSARTLLLDEIRGAIAAAGAADDFFDRGDAGGLAYVIYTSGSTGRPKGVKVGHRALTNLLCSMRRVPGFTARDKLLAITTVCFDIAGLELFLPLVAGGAVELVSAAVAADGSALRRQIERSSPTVMQATPATWRMLIATGWAGDPNLKILCGGEALPADLAGELVRRGREVWNLYGPTETTIWSSISRVEPGRTVTIGRPIANTQLYVLDGNMAPAPAGAPAELFIAGDGVAEGYLGRPELTAERFLPCNFGPEGARMYRTGDIVRLREDGEIEYLHRRDRQVKLHGYRIEPAEIEYALRRYASVREAVVLVREDAPGDRRLVAYVVSDPVSEPSPAELRAHLKAILPAHQVPTVFVPLSRIPLTPNGKVDYSALPKPAAAGNNAIADAFADTVIGDLERRIAGIWSEVLGHPITSADQTFFEAGGTSLLLMETARRMQAAMDRPVTSTDMFANPTVRGMAAFLAGKREECTARGPRESPADALSELRRRRLALHRRGAVTE